MFVQEIFLIQKHHAKLNILSTSVQHRIVCEANSLKQAFWEMLIFSYVKRSILVREACALILKARNNPKAYNENAESIFSKQKHAQSQ